MNKTDLVQAIATSTGVAKKDVEAVFVSLFGKASEAGIIETTLASGDKVEIVGFGNFGTTERQARKGRNPQTGEEISIPAKLLPNFKAGKRFKDTVATTK